MLPASPYYPTPQSPAPTGTPQPDPVTAMETDHKDQSTQSSLGGGTAAGPPDARPLDAHGYDTATTTGSLGVNPLPTPALDDSHSLASLMPIKPELDSPAPLPLAASTPEDADRKPSLPPPEPFASTSASVAEIDAKKEEEQEEGEEDLKPRSRSISLAAAGGSGFDSGASTPRAGGSSGEDSEEVKPMGGKNLKKGKGKAKKVESEPQFIGHLPRAEEAAGATYEELPECTYFSKKLGDLLYWDEDAARCDCQVHSDIPADEQACGEHSNCVNRLMQIECLKGDCRCGRACQNQRFQKKQYAPIEIVQTEKKGFGVRAGADMSADTFVYEYVGEVIGPAPFQRKMKEYANEGIKHFYFMALDKDVFIDATKRGGKGRFLNHSCNPNCVVAKWTVGRKMRMGIFTKRDIKKDEELTFNYNVDRYGHVAQECYCGEPNCVGFIGGKTQTDLGGMDDLYIDALGITEEVEALGLKGSKKKKGKKLDEDFVPTLYPIQLDEVPKVMAAMRQALQTRRILEKLLTRVQLTDDDEVQRNLLRLHGLNLMHNILREYPKDVEVVVRDLEILGRWRLQTRNKIESSKIEESVVKCVEMEDEKVKALAAELLRTWGELKLGYRIPKADDPDRKRPSDFSIDQLTKRPRIEELHPVDEEVRPAFVRPTANQIDSRSGSFNRRPLPDGWEVRYDYGTNSDYYLHVPTGLTQKDVPRPGDAAAALAAANAARAKPAVVLSAAELIAQAEAEAQRVKDEAAAREAEEKAARERERQEAKERKKAEREDKDRERRDKKVMSLFSGVVVGTMSKYKGQFEPEAFKKRAKEVCSILCEKEKKRPTYATDNYDSLTPDKEAKIKSYVKDWVKKLLERKKGGGGGGSGSSRGSNASTPLRPSSSSALAKGGEPSPATPGAGAMDVDLPFSATNGNGAASGSGSGSPGTPPRPTGAVASGLPGPL
ncbi:hypothetical protein JCM8097_002285 [Rhodosporidiobolus ruineniae]